jgi:hypothetical protein
VGLNFDLGPVLDQRHDLHGRHGREVLADNLSIGLADALEIGEVFLLVDKIVMWCGSPPAARTTATTFSSVCLTWLTKSSVSNWHWLFQPIWPPTKISRPCASTPLA